MTSTTSFAFQTQGMRLFSTHTYHGSRAQQIRDFTFSLVLFQDTSAGTSIAECPCLQRLIYNQANQLHLALFIRNYSIPTIIAHSSTYLYAYFPIQPSSAYYFYPLSLWCQDLDCSQIPKHAPDHSIGRGCFTAETLIADQTTARSRLACERKELEWIVTHRLLSAFTIPQFQ